MAPRTRSGSGASRTTATTTTPRTTRSRAKAVNHDSNGDSGSTLADSPAKSVVSSPTKRSGRRSSRKAAAKEPEDEEDTGEQVPEAVELAHEMVEASPRKVAKTVASPSKGRQTPILSPKSVNINASTVKRRDLRTMVLDGDRRESGSFASPPVRRPRQSAVRPRPPVGSPTQPPPQIRASPLRSPPAVAADASFLTDADAEGSFLSDGAEWEKAETSAVLGLSGLKEGAAFVRMRGRMAPEEDEEWPGDDDGEWTMEGEAAVEVEFSTVESADAEEVEKEAAETSEAEDLVSSLPVNLSPRKDQRRSSLAVGVRPRSSLAIGVNLPPSAPIPAPILDGLSGFAAEQALFDEFLVPAQDVDVPFGAPVSLPHGSEAGRLRAVAEAEDDLRYGYACLEDGRELEFATSQDAPQQAVGGGDAAIEQDGMEPFLDVSLLAHAGNQSLNGLSDLYERIMNPLDVTAPPTIHEEIEDAPLVITSRPLDADEASPAADLSFNSTSCSDDSVPLASPPHPDFCLAEPDAVSPVPPSTTSEAVSDLVEGSLEDTLALPSEGDSDAVILQSLAASSANDPVPTEADSIAPASGPEPLPPSAVLALPSLSEELCASPSASPIALNTAIASRVRPTKASSPARSSTPPPPSATESHSTPQELRRSPIRRAGPPNPAGRSAAPTQRRQLTAATSQRPPLAKTQSLTVTSTSELREGSTAPAATKRPSSLTAFAFGSSVPSTSRTHLPNGLVKRPNLSSRATAPVVSTSASARPLQLSSKARTVPPVTTRPTVGGRSDVSAAPVASSSAEPTKSAVSRLPGPAPRPAVRPVGLTRPRSPRRNGPAAPAPTRPAFATNNSSRSAPPATTSATAKPAPRPGLEKRTSSFVTGRPATTASSAPAAPTEIRSGVPNRMPISRPPLNRPPSAPPITRPEARLAGPSSRLATAMSNAASRRAPFVPAPRPASASSNTSSGSSASVRARPAPTLPKSRLADPTPASRPQPEAPRPAIVSPRRIATTGAAPAATAPAQLPTSWPAGPAIVPSPTRLASRVFGLPTASAEAVEPPTPRSPRRIPTPASPQRQAGRAPSPLKARNEEPALARAFSPVRQQPIAPVEGAPAINFVTSTIFGRSPSRTMRSRTGLTERIEVSAPEPPQPSPAPVEPPIPEDPLAAARARAAVFVLPPRSPRSPYRPSPVEPEVTPAVVESIRSPSPARATTQLQGQSRRQRGAVDVPSPAEPTPSAATDSRPRRPKPTKPRPQLTDVQLKQITHQNTTRNGAHFNTLEIKEERMNCARPPSPSSKIRRSLGAPPSKEAARAMREDRAKKRALRDSTDEARRESLAELSQEHFVGAGDEEGGFRSPVKEKSVAATALGKRKRTLKDVKWDRRLLVETDESALSSPRTARVRVIEAKSILKDVELDHLGNVPEALQPLPSEVNRTYVVVKKRIYDDDDE